MVKLADTHHLKRCAFGRVGSSPTKATMTMIILDRDGLLNVNSKDINSPYYYILRKEDLLLKPKVKEAMEFFRDKRVVLATRQKCISKGLVSEEQVKEINDYLCELLGFTFEKIYVQIEGDDKTETFQKIIDEYGTDLILIDDSEKECEAAKSLGIMARCTDDLHSFVVEAKQWQQEVIDNYYGSGPVGRGNRLENGWV